VTKKKNKKNGDDIPERIGHYDVSDVLGMGGMSTVYRGIQPSLNRSVAIKVLPLHMAKDDELIDRFERESSIIANLNHPNIIQIFDRGVDEGSYYIVMEHVDGGGLDELMKKKLPIYQLVNIALQIASGLEFAHTKGVVHRDIKPSNILIASDSGTVKISDFGIAKLAEEQMADRMLTRDKVAMGTADYMSPEQRRDSRSIDARSDIFSFGVLVYEMVTGRIPVGRFRNLHDLRDDTPPLLNQIVFKCLQEDPGDRYPSFTEVIADLNRLTQKGLAYREAIDKVAESVFHIKRKAKTAISNGVTSETWPKRLKVVGLIAAGMALSVYLIVMIIGSLGKEPTTETKEVKVEAAPVIEAEDEFDIAEDLLKEKRYDDALNVLRGVRTTAGGTGDKKNAAEAQWRVAKIHEQRGSTHYAGIAFGYFADTYGKSTDIVSDEQISEALFKAGMIKAGEKETQRALNYLRGLREKYPENENVEEAMAREIIVLHDQVRPSRSTREKHRQSIVWLGRTFCDRYPESDRREEVFWRMHEVYLQMGGDPNELRAINTLEEMGRDFPRSVYLPLYEAAEIARKKLKDKSRARRLYQAFLETNPGSDKADDARKRLKKL
jgi:TolA-binding protein